MSSSQRLDVQNRIHRQFHAHPVAHGLPWPEGAVQPGDAVVVRDGEGEAVAAAMTPLNLWPDGSVQWGLLDTVVDLAPSGQRSLTVEAGGDAGPAPAHPLAIEEAGESLRLSNGLMALELSSAPGELLRSWTEGERAVVEPGGLDVTFRHEQKVYSLAAAEKTMTLQRQSPLCAVVRIEGKHTAEDGATLLDFILRVTVWANRRDISIAHQFRNREEPTPGVEIHELHATVQAAGLEQAEKAFCASNITRHYRDKMMRVPEDIEIVGAAVGDLENFPEHHEPRKTGTCFIRDPKSLRDPNEDKPWFLRNQMFRAAAVSGERCTWPYVALMGEQGGLLGLIRQMTTLHPKCLRTQAGRMVFGIWPDWAGPLAITQGAGRSHELLLSPVPAGASDLDVQSLYLDWEDGGLHTHIPGRASVSVSMDLDHVRRCGVFAIDKLPVHDTNANYLFERKVRHEWLGVKYGQLGATFETTLPTAAGFWDYGDAGLSNNEEMHNLVYFQQYLRSGDFGCLEAALAGTRHMMEVDHVAYSTDPLQHDGMVAHCLNHNNGAAYPSHMWFTELLFAYALTGDPDYKETAMRACDCLLTWLDDEEGFHTIAHDQREAGQPMINLTWCYHFNRDPRYLDACWKIVRESLMAKVERYGRMYDALPNDEMPIHVTYYGDYASWEGMFWLWEITRDEQLKQFMLSQAEWRVSEAFSGIQGFHRVTDYNPAAYAYYLTGDASWLTRVGRPFRAAFRSAKWPLGWVHAMYYMKLAFDHGIVDDEMITPQ